MELLPPYLVRNDDLSTQASGLAAQRVRLNVIANNMANVNTTRDEHGNFSVYMRKEVIFRAREINEKTPDEQGVEVHQIMDSKAPLKRVFEPGHPDANEQGFRFEPNVSISREMVNMIEATRAYDANLRSMKVRSGALSKTNSILEPNTPKA